VGWAYLNYITVMKRRGFCCGREDAVVMRKRRYCCDE
jgi:4-hydroxy-3-methylbut-2-enyl diphosphate reductase IspH